MRRYPPIPELVAFEAVARHQSFTSAAEELCLTQSAVSHRIRRLEIYLGKVLIRRLNPGLELTTEGKDLLPDLTAALESLAKLGNKQERCLRVVAHSALCQWWLAGRLTGFMAQNPGVSVELISRDAPDPSLTNIDIRIGWVGVGEDRPTETQAPLFCEHVFPVCSPNLLPDNRPLAIAQDLTSLSLLRKATKAIGEWSWPVWFDHLDINAPKNASAELRFADMGLIMSAAVNGSGVAIARSLLAYDALEKGILVVPIKNFKAMQSTKKHIARWSAEKKDDPDIDAFVRWIVTEAASTLAATEQFIRPK